jgi:hypothetical protein
MRSTTTTIETNIHEDRLGAGFVAGAAGVLAVCGGAPTGAVGANVSATGVLTGSAGAGVAAGVAAGFGGRSDGRVR